MSNERLKGEVRATGRSVEDIATHVEVDPKTVERWLTTDRIPHRRHRHRLVQLLGKDELYFWPQLETEAVAASGAEIVALHPSRGSIPSGTWESLIDSATDSIDLWAYAASFLHDSVDRFAERLRARAEAGVRVRLLFADPTGEAVVRRGEEEGIGRLLAARCELTWAYLRPVLSEPAIEARRHDTTVYASVFRFDEDLLANLHTYGAAASTSPVLHLHQVPGGRLFATYEESFERCWDRAQAVSQAHS